MRVFVLLVVVLVAACGKDKAPPPAGSSETPTQPQPDPAPGAREAATKPALPDAAVEPAPVVDAGSAGDRLKRFEKIGPKLEPATVGAQPQRKKP